MTVKSIEQLLSGFRPGHLSATEQQSLLSLVEFLCGEWVRQKEEIQLLRDEINRLKGEDGKPKISGRNQKETNDSEKDDSSNISSEQNRRKKGKPRKARLVKFDKDRVADETIVLDFEDRSHLPNDVEFKGYATSHYQGLAICSKLIEIRRKVYYSSSAGKTYTVDLPPNYEEGSDYTQELKGHVCMFKYGFGLSIPKIVEFMQFHGVDISGGTISNILLANGAILNTERLEIHEAGLLTGDYSATDTTAARFNGVNYHTHVFGNEDYTTYFTTEHKDRQTVLDLIRTRTIETNRTYVLNDKTVEFYHYLKIPKKITALLENHLAEHQMTSEVFKTVLKNQLGTLNYEKQEQKLMEGAYLSAYYAQNPLSVLLCDDAPQYKLLAEWIALCWVHTGRHFKKLNPRAAYHQQLLQAFSERFWAFYDKLKAYKDNQNATLIDANTLADEFDEIFTTKTGYQCLDDRIKKTLDNKKELLVVLQYKNVPLHNNDAELAVRKQVRYRDISFQTRTKDGTIAKDVFFTIIQTCKKWGINSYLYIMDRITKKYEYLKLGDLIYQKYQTSMQY